jgi:hypothetical protein
MRGLLVVTMLTLAVVGPGHLQAQSPPHPSCGRPNGGWIERLTPAAPTRVDAIRMRRAFGSGTIIGATADARLGGWPVMEPPI